MRLFTTFLLLTLLSFGSIAGHEDAPKPRPGPRIVPLDCSLVIRITSGISGIHPVRNFFRGRYLVGTPIGMVRHEVFESRSDHSKLHSRRVYLKHPFEGMTGVVQNQALVEDKDGAKFNYGHSKTDVRAGLSYVWNDKEEFWSVSEISSFPEPSHMLIWETDVIGGEIGRAHV